VAQAHRRSGGAQDDATELMVEIFTDAEVPDEGMPTALLVLVGVAPFFAQRPKFDFHGDVL
jgi:hypothetical protein